jgi:hypothetical protein
MKKRPLWVIWLLSMGNMTAAQIQVASAVFHRPFKSVKRLQNELTQMFRAGIINRQPMLNTGPGQKPFLYHLGKNAKRLCPELKDYRNDSVLFRGRTEPREDHDWAAAEFLAQFLRSTTQAPIEILAVLDDGQFSFTADVPRLKRRRSIPDKTIIIRTPLGVELLLIELERRNAAVHAISKRWMERSVQAKWRRFQAFIRNPRAHRAFTHLESSMGVTIKRVRLLVPVFTGYGEAEDRRRMKTLMAAAADGEKPRGRHKRLSFVERSFSFSTLGSIRAAENPSLSMIWYAPTGKCHRLIDPHPTHSASAPVQKNPAERNMVSCPCPPDAALSCQR